MSWIRNLSLAVALCALAAGPSHAQVMAWMMDWLPIKLLSRDNILSMRVDNVCGCPFPEMFGFSPTALEAVVPLYLLDNTPRARYRWFRLRARH